MGLVFYTKWKCFLDVVFFLGGVVTNMAFVETGPLHRQCRVALLSKHRLVLGRLQDRLAIFHTGTGEVGNGRNERHQH